MFLQLNMEVFWTFFNIIVFFLILRKFLFKPVTKIMEERKAIITKGLDEADAAKEEAQKMKTEYEASIANAKEEAQGIIADAKDRANMEYQGKIKQANEEIAQMKESASEDVKAEKERAMVSLQSEIAGIALLAASKVVEKEVDKASNEQLVDDFLKEAGV
ncbi:MAG: F0F1 ATP synthase subunit B [Anaerostipes sp.]|nr:F0F1 ATP synthase subunit B [Anaerostipes sp.]